MSIWYSRRKKEGKSLRLAAAGKSAFCFAELHYNARSLTHAATVVPAGEIDLERVDNVLRSRPGTPRESRRRGRFASIVKLIAKNKETTEKGRKEFPFGLF